MKKKITVKISLEADLTKSTQKEIEQMLLEQARKIIKETVNKVFSEQLFKELGI